MKKSVLALASVLLAAGISSTGNAQAANRNYISIVGSSTVYPFATVVAERFGKVSGFKTPKIESTGSGGGIKLFCSGLGVQTPDITNSSRRIKKSEFDSCQNNGVTHVVEVLIGYDGIAIANSVKADQMELSRQDLFLALAKEVPNRDGSDSLISNPYKTWQDVNGELPAIKIEVLGPPPTSGTRDAFVELAMEHGCKQYPFINAMDKNEFKAICHGVREDGAYVEAGENDNLIVQKLDANPRAIGIFGYSFLEQNSDKVRSSLMEGVEADFDTISDGSYPISRPLYFYVKGQHIDQIPGIAEYLKEFTSEGTWGEDGYLADKGMIPLGDDLRFDVKDAVDAQEKLVLA